MSRRRGAKGTTTGSKAIEGSIRISYDKIVYSALYTQVEANLKHELEKVSCKGVAHPLKGNRQRWIYFIYAIQFLFALFLMMGDDILKRYVITIDEIWMEKIRSNKYMLIPGVMMLSPIRQLLSSTSAFEVYFNEELIYSTLKENTPPSPKILMERISEKCNRQLK